MKTTALYTSLTMPQRLRAMVSAFGRMDQEELDRLADSSPDGCGTVRKVKLHLRNLAHLAALHNSLLLEPCAVWLMSQTFSPEETRGLSDWETEAIETSRDMAIEEAASIEAAITGRITASGISACDWQAYRERLLGSGAKFLLQTFLNKTSGRENPALVAQYEDAIEGYLFKDAA